MPSGKRLADLRIDIPQNDCVYVSDDYVVVRNLRSIYSQDDGFAGFWGMGVVFENINGSYNCDQGFSMHGTSVSLIDGGLFERNGGCGICDVMSSASISRNVVVRDNMIAGAIVQVGEDKLGCFPLRLQLIADPFEYTSICVTEHCPGYTSTMSQSDSQRAIVPFSALHVVGYYLQ